jgi:hypothetical protein
VDRPFANSLATDFYRQLPNATDVNSFSERGWTTLNFAMIGNETRYHSPGDDLAALDLRSLQHMGDQALAVARQFAASDPGGDGSVLFADIAGLQLVVIPQIAGFVLLGLLVLAFAFVSFHRGGSLRGLLTVAAGIVVAAAIAWAAFCMMGVLRPGSFWRGHPVWTELAVYACGLLGATMALALIGRRLSIEQLRASYWLGFLLLGVAVFFIAPGGVIYFLLPPLAALIGTLVKQERIGAIIAALLLWLTFGEVLALLGELMNNGPFFIFAPLALLIATPWLIEAKALIDGTTRTSSIAASAILALIAWGAVAAAPAYSANRQQRFVIQHVTDTGTGRAYWSVVNDGAPLPEAFGNLLGWHRAELPFLKGKRWVAPAAALADLQPPRLQLLGGSSTGGLRTVSFGIEANGADTVTLIGDKDAKIVAAGTAGFVRPISSAAKGEYYLQCSGRSCAGAILQFTTRDSRPLTFTLVGLRRGLPATAEPLADQRPANARPQYTPDSTFTLSRVRL